MTDNHTDGKSLPRWLLKRAPATLAGVLLLGLICTILYDLVVKPGLSVFGRFSLNVLTFGSQGLRDAAYASAGLDPTPVTPLILLIALVSVSTLPLVNMLTSFVPRSRSSREMDDLLKKLHGAADREREAIENQIITLDEKRSRRRRIILVLFAVVSLSIYVPFAVHNQAILTWRTFNANLSILRPAMSEEEYVKLRADFCSMKCKDDYLAIQTSLTAAAEREGITLREISLW
jgi:hypothetical protein